ncbi:MAG: SDR family NAD(P)-dependent oxidoreductase [Beijerinckiaceae bacterium]
MPLASTRDIRLEGRTAIVTGAARGLGKAMATALIGAGANVVFADIDWQEAQRAADAAGGGDRSAGAFCDIRSRAQCRHLVDETIRAYGGLHILINNAALGPTHIETAPQTRSMKFYEADPEAWTRVIDTNVNGTYLMSYCAVPHMIAAGWGRIINITTSLSTMQRLENSPYGVTKTAIEAETLIWAQDLAGTGVTVNSLIPGGAADTDFVSAPTREKMAATGRKLISPAVMADPLLWLCSPEADEVTAARYVGRLWDSSLPPSQAAKGALELPVLRDPAQELR